MRLVPARLTHVGPLALNMREADVAECHALGRTPKEALRMGLRTSLYSLTAIEEAGEPVAMLGLNVASALSGAATPWLLGTDRVFTHPRELLRFGRDVIGSWRREFPCMENIVSADNDRAIRLLRHWGAEIGADEQMHGGVVFVTFRFPAINGSSQCYLKSSQASEKRRKKSRKACGRGLALARP